MVQQSETTYGVTVRPAPTPARGTPAFRTRTVVADAGEPLTMDLTTLMRHCAIESDRFYRGQPHDTRYSYELFRRALVDRCDAAWELVYSHYSPLVESWVRRCGAFASSGESSEYFVVSAFTRFWRAITAERFAQFPSLPSLLQYLQRCTGCVVIDSVRAQSWAEMRGEESVGPHHTSQIAPDEQAIERVDREEFWQFINTLLNDDAEKVVVVESFVLGMKPGDIFARHGKLFNSITDVYNLKRNVLSRLARNHELRRLLVP
jgi:DNA-directed RNA polymerase specialized sigma24 family protein